MEYVGDRSVLDDVNARKDDAELARDRALKNRASIDGLPAVDW